MYRKVWGESADGKFEYVSLTSDCLSGAQDIIEKSFIPNEAICIACDIKPNTKAAEVVLHLSKETAHDGTSIVAVEKLTGTVVAVTINKLQVKGPNNATGFDSFLAQCTDERVIAFIKNMIEVDEEIDKQFEIDCYLELQYLATLNGYTGRGLAKGLGQATIDLARAVANEEFIIRPLSTVSRPTIDTANGNVKKPKAVFSQFTSFGSQRVGEHLGMHQVKEFPYEHFFYNGIPYSELISPKLGRSIILYMMNIP